MTDLRTSERRLTGPVRVNLLPPELEQRKRARRVTNATLALVLVWVLLLGGIYALKVGAVNQARSDRDDAQAQVSQLQSRLAQLEEFRILAQRLETGNALLATAMSTEISWARVLNDLSLAFPSNASMLTLAATATPPVADQAAQPGGVSFGEDVADVAFTGYSVERYAPGVETVLIQFDGARGFFHSFLQTAGEEERGTTEVTNFTGNVELNDQAYTDRYAEGLPEEVTP